MRLPKEIYFAHRVMQNPQPDIHILGHWTYPADTTKTVYVLPTPKSVELFVNGKSLGKNSNPEPMDLCLPFPTEVATGNAAGRWIQRRRRSLSSTNLRTVGAAKRIKLTPIVGPTGWQADGQDVALIDVEVVDEQGRRCPTDDARVDFTVTGPAVLARRLQQRQTKSTNNLYLNTECGINRVAVRSTLTAGKVTIKASRDGLENAQVELESKPVKLQDGLSEVCADPTFAKR